jgi:hypothetical protein
LKDEDGPLIGKLVKILALGRVLFHDPPDGSDEDLDLNWKRLCSMAYPVVDEQLANMAIAGNWKNKPIHLDLGTLFLDNATIHFDKESYNKMNKDNKADSIQCEVA